MKTTAKIFLTSLIATTLFVFIDALIHFFTPLKVISSKYSIIPFINNPLALYIIGKFIVTFIMLSLLLLLLSKAKLKELTGYSVITLLIVSLLELRYMFDPYYGILWHAINFISHYIELLGSLYLAKLVMK